MMIMTKIFNHLLCVRTHSKHFMCINLYDLQSKPYYKKGSTLISIFHKRKLSPRESKIN